MTVKHSISFTIPLWSEIPLLVWKEYKVMFHETQCEDFECYECYWDMIGELKEIFRQCSDAYDSFCKYLDDNMLWDSIRMVDGNIYFHKYTKICKLGYWRRFMYYLYLKKQ